MESGSADGTQTSPTMRTRANCRENSEIKDSDALEVEDFT